MIEINMPIKDILTDYDGIAFIGKNGESYKILLNEQEKALLKERLQEK